MKILPHVIAGAILGLATLSLAKHIQRSAEWAKSGELANRAIAQAKRHSTKESK